jgi:hypothetical protein
MRPVRLRAIEEQINLLQTVLFYNIFQVVQESDTGVVCPKYI